MCAEAGRAAGARTPRCAMRRRGNSSPRHRPAGSTLAAVLEYARARGGPALREMTFHRAGRPAQALAKRLARVQGGVLRALLLYRSDQRRFLDRHRRRHRHAVRIRRQGRARAAERPCVSRRRRRSPLQSGRFPRTACLCSARRRGGAHQRVQFPGVGDAREARALPARRRADHRETGHGDGLPHGVRRASNHRVGDSARGRAAARVRWPGRSVRSPHLSGHGLLHRIGAHGRAAAYASLHRAPFGPVHRRDQFIEFQHPCARCGAGHDGIRLVHRGGRPRDDRQGRSEVHGHPQGARAGAVRRSRRSRRSRPPCAKSSSATRARRECAWDPW